MPCIISTTLRGKLSGAVAFITSSAVRSFVTRNSARSPTTLLDGVTLTMSPTELVGGGVGLADLRPAVSRGRGSSPAAAGWCTGRPASRAGTRPDPAPSGPLRTGSTAREPPPSSGSARRARSDRARCRARCAAAPRTMLLRHGWLVMPLIDARAASAMSTPASAARSTLAALMPLVSCVWKWIGTPTSSRSAFTSAYAAYGLQRPAMSLMPRTCVPIVDQLLREADVVVERVLRARRIEDVAGVADRRLADRRRVLADRSRWRAACCRSS